MTTTHDLKARAQALEAEGKLPEAIAMLREGVTRLEGTAEFLKELPMLVRLGDLELRAGNADAALACYERAIEAYIKHGRADSVIAAGLRIARVRPDPARFFDYALQLSGHGHVDAARRVLTDTARRTGHGSEADELELLADAPVAEIAAAVERIASIISGRVATRRPSRAMSLQDAIAEMRRKSGITERSHGEADLPPAPPAPRRKRRRLVPVLLLGAVVTGAAGLAWTFYQAPNLESPPMALEQPAPAAARAPVVEAPPPQAAEREASRVPVGRAGAVSPAVGAGLLAADRGALAAPAVPTAAAPERAATVPAVVDMASIESASPNIPRLPAGAVVTRAVVAVRGLSITRIEDAGRGYRLVQPLSVGATLELSLTPFPGTGMSEPRVTAAADGSAGTMRFQGYMVTARAPVSPDSLHRLMLRLVEVPPRQ